MVVLGIVLAMWSPGRSHGCHGANTAMRRSTPPTARENGRPYLHTFSIKITTASATIAGMFIAPTAISTIISPQQQATQYEP